MMFAGIPFIPGLGNCFASASVFQGRAWDLDSPGMEVRTHLSSATLCPPAL